MSARHTAVVLVALCACRVHGFAVAPMTPKLRVNPQLTLPRQTVPRGGNPKMSPTLAAAAAVYCPVAGVFLSNALFCSPLLAVIDRIKAGSLGSLNPLPPTLTVLSTIAWLQYGLSIRNPYVVASNVPGLIAAITGFVSMLPLMTGAASLPLTKRTFIAGASATSKLPASHTACPSAQHLPPIRATPLPCAQSGSGRG